MTAQEVKDDLNELENSFSESLGESDVQQGIDQLEKEANKPASDIKYRNEDDKRKEAENQTPEGRQNNRRSETKRRVIIGAGAGGGILGGIFLIGGIFNFQADFGLGALQDKFFAGASEAIEHRAEKLIVRYLGMTALGLSDETCGPNMAPGCRRQYYKGIASNLFSNWRDANIEEILEKEYRMKVEYDTRTRGFKITDLDTGEVFEHDPGRDGPKIGTPGNTFGSKFDNFMRERGRVTTVMHRKGIKDYHARKFDQKRRCFFLCEWREQRKDKNFTRKQKFKTWLIEKAVMPISDRVGSYMLCAINDCFSDDSKFRKDVKNVKILQIVDSKLSKEILEQLGEKTFKEVILEKIMTKVLTKIGVKGAGAAASRITNAIPVVGQILLAIQIFDILNTVDRAIDNNAYSRLIADMKSNQMVEAYFALQEGVDENKTGQLTSDEVASLNESLVDFDKSALYQNEFSDSNPSRNGFTCPSGEKVGGEPSDDIPNDRLVCEEMWLQGQTWFEELRDNPVIAAIADTMFFQYRVCLIPILPDFPGTQLINGYNGGLDDSAHCEGAGDIPETTICAPFDGPCQTIPAVGLPFTNLEDIIHGSITAFEDFIGGILEPVMNAIRTAAEAIPPVKAALDWFQSKATELFQFAVEKLFPPLLNGEEVGPFLFDALAGGANVVGMDFMRDELGAPQITDEQAQVVWETRKDKLEDEYRQRSFFARMFATDHWESPLVKFSLAMPVSGLNFMTSFREFAYGGFNMVGSMVSPIVGRASAAEKVDVYSAIGYPSFGWTADNPELDMDPGDLTEEFCKEREDARKEDSDLSLTEFGFDTYATANPCMLEEFTVDAIGTMFEPIDEGNSGGGGGPTVPSGTAQEMAQKLLDPSSGVTFQGPFRAGESGARDNIEQAAAGQPSATSIHRCSNAGVSEVLIHEDLLRLMLTLGENLETEVNVSSITNGCHGDGSDHYAGQAIDIAGGTDRAEVSKYVFENREALKVRQHWDDLHTQWTVNGGNPANQAIGGHSDHTHTAVWGNRSR